MIVGAYCLEKSSGQLCGNNERAEIFRAGLGDEGGLWAERSNPAEMPPLLLAIQMREHAAGLEDTEWTSEEFDEVFKELPSGRSDKPMGLAMNRRKSGIELPL